MSFEKLLSATSRLFFFGAFALLAIAVLERIANATGYTILQLYNRGGHLLEFAVVLLIFVVAIQLRAMRDDLKRRP